MYLLIRVKSLMSLKVLSNLGLANKISKSLFSGDFYFFVLKVRNSYGGSSFFSKIFLKIAQKPELASQGAHPSRAS